MVHNSVFDRTEMMAALNVQADQLDLDSTNENSRFSDIYSKPEVALVCVLLILYNLLKISFKSK